MNWGVNIDNFLGGFAPKWYAEDYPSYGNKNQAGDMSNVSLMNPGYLTQGFTGSALTNGTQASAVTTLIKGIMPYAVTSTTVYGIGGNKLYQFSSDTVTSNGTLPHTIDKSGVTGEDGWDVAYYGSYVYYAYNHSGSAGDIGRYDKSSTFVDDWGSTVPGTGAAALQGASSTAGHQMIVGGNDILYIANEQYIASYDKDSDVFEDQALDFPAGKAMSIQWMSDRLWIGYNRPTVVSGVNAISSIYIWDGTTTSWESEIRVGGQMSALYAHNGVMYAFYNEVSVDAYDGDADSFYKVGYVNGAQVVDLFTIPGTAPKYYQVGSYRGFIIWGDSTGDLYAMGSGDPNLPMRLFNFGSGTHSTLGGLTVVFGAPVLASNASTNYILESFSEFATSCSWKSLLFDITGSGKVAGQIDNARINFEKLVSGARVDWSLKDNKGKTLYSDTISYSKLGAVTSAYYPLGGTVAENFRIEFDFSNGSTTAPVKIKSVKIYGTN